jgi:pimeloyl-ACP methyl ester carboxylesterase
MTSATIPPVKTAALLPGRVVACATIGGVAPLEADGLDWLAGMGPENIAEFGAAMDGPAALQPYLERAAASLADVTGEQVAEALGGLIDEVDRGALSGEFAEYLAVSFRDAVRTGLWGWFDDDLAFTRGWGFDLRALGVPVTIWQGAHDRIVPFDHGRWLARHVAGARAELLPGEGHLSLAISRLGDIVDRLLTEA